MTPAQRRALGFIVEKTGVDPVEARYIHIRVLRALLNYHAIRCVPGDEMLLNPRVEATDEGKRLLSRVV